MAKKRLIDKAAFNKRPGGSEEVSPLSVWGKSMPDMGWEATAVQRPWSEHAPGMFKDRKEGLVAGRGKCRDVQYKEMRSERGQNK